MEPNDKMGMGAKIEAVTYVFASDPDKEMLAKVTSGLRTKVWQILPVVCASLSCLPFGLMLGWPSPTNPILIQPQSIVPISIDQSAMVAGFLMIGNALGTPFSKKSFIESKYGILLGVAFMTVGWFLMWQSQNIFWLLGSRLLVGFGNGYGVGQLKIYISELCDDSTKVTLTKHLNLYVLASLVAIYCFGPFTDFRRTGFISLLLSVAIFFLLLLLPSTPASLIRARQVDQAGKLLSFTKPGVNPSDEVTRIAKDLETTETDYGLWTLAADSDLCKRFLIFAFLVFCQQWSGAPATITYAQIMFEKSPCPNAAYLAIAYAVTFFMANVVGIYLTPRFDKRSVLLFSSAGVVVLIVAKMCVIFFRLNEVFWSYSSVPVMILYISVHTIGLGSVPVTLIGDFFPKEYRTWVTHFFVMFHSILALVATKIFQVLITRYNVGVAFCLFLTVSVIAFVFIYFVVPKKTEPTQSIKIFVTNLFK